MSSAKLSFHTRFLVRGEDGYEISGYPGVAIAVLPHAVLGGEEAISWYRRVIATDTMATVLGDDSLSVLEEATLESLGIKPSTVPPSLRRLYIGSEKELAWFADRNLRISSAVQQFAGVEALFSFILLNNMAEEVLGGLDKDLRYYIRSNEQGHNAPHVHVCYRNEQSASVGIVDGKVLAGKLPNRALKRAVDRILANQEILLQYWNAHTNGVYFDINYYFQAQEKASR